MRTPAIAVSIAGSLSLALILAACEATPPAGPEAAPLSTNVTGVAHHVSAGGADVCSAMGLPPGCDANFSLTANQLPDGSIEGQWEDVIVFFDPPPPFLPVHVAIDCLVVDGNEAWVSGVVTRPEGAAGIPVTTRVVDNGRSVHEPLDQVSRLGLFEPSCTERPDLPLFDLHEGQVTVR